MTETRPYVRWWWFAGDIKNEDIKRQIAWFSEQGFGGVEIAWVYPWPLNPSPKKILRLFSSEWVDAVAYALQTARSCGISVDFTYGTLWPFGGTFIPNEHASQCWDGPSEQRLRRSWESAYSEQPGNIMNHLDASSLAMYDSIVGAALEKVLKKASINEDSTTPSAFFTDSWEVHPEKLWSVPLGALVKSWYGWDMSKPPEDVLYEPKQRYRYREALAEIILKQFYHPLSAVCRSRGALSRVQAHGAPTDLIRAYGSADIPESEAVLFDPSFSLIASSAAAISGKTVVSAEAGTCLYGWKAYPQTGPFQKQEDPSDVLLCAHSLIAYGVNHLVWHGAPFQTLKENQEFYASIHIAPDGSLSSAMKPINLIAQQLCEYMRRGIPASEVAVYLPLEDRWMEDRLKPSQCRPSAAYHWELHYESFPDFLQGYQPTWITGFALYESMEIHEDRTFSVGKARFKALVLSGVSWVSTRGARAIIDLIGAKVPVLVDAKLQVIDGYPLKMSVDELQRELDVHVASVHKSSIELKSLGIDPWVISEDPSVLFRLRTQTDRMTYYIAPQEAAEITYPMEYRQSSACRDHSYKLYLKKPETGYAFCQVDMSPGEAVVIEVSQNQEPTIHRFFDPFRQ